MPRCRCLLLIVVVLAAGGSGCRRPGPSQVDIYARPAADETASLQLGAQRGERAAQRELGLRYYGGDGVSRNPARAAYWWQQAAAQGDDQAQVALAALYFKGEGVAQDRAQALRWWQKAAAGGNGDAQATLGWVYFNGVGVPRDRVMGLAWTNLAAGSGIQRATANLEAFRAQVAPAERAQAQQLSAAWRAQIGARLAPGVKEGRLQKVGEGTVFLINADGGAVTAQHVVIGCAQLRLRGRSGLATVQAADPEHDLALLRVPGEIGEIATLSADPLSLRQGDPVVVFGFPLNAWLSTGGNLTPGWVSALTGLGNDPNQVQITAPIQPGSSGSPVLDRHGLVVGVVSMRLSDARMHEATGTSGQNLNFAVSGARLNAFLTQHRAEFATGGFWRLPRQNADIADEARDYTGVIECWK